MRFLRRARRHDPLSVEALESRRVLAAELVHDFNTNPADGLPALSNLFKVDDKVYFASNSGLWKTDGTEAGTVPTDRIPVGNMGDKLFFEEGSELLVGTDSDGPLTSLASPATQVFGGGTPVWNGQFFFRGGYTNNGYGLWKTDGTPAGTVPVKDISPDSDDPSMSFFTPAANFLYFVADDGTSGRELWRTNGTEAGTQMVADLAPGTATSSPRDLTAIGNTLYFLADDDEGLYALYKVVGAGVPALIAPDVDGGTLTVVGSTLFFSRPAAEIANPIGTVNNRELWKIDASGTASYIATPLNVDDNRDTFLDMVALGNKLFFIAHDDEHAYEPWISDGTPAGTHMITEMSPGRSYSLYGFQRELTVIGDEVFLIDHTAEVWKSDGTAAGTQLITTLDYFANLEALPQDLVALGDKLLFIGYDFDTGKELFVSDGTAAGTHVLKDVKPGTTSSRPEDLIVAGDKLYLEADDYVVDLHSNGRAYSLFGTDGQTATQVPLDYEIAAMAPLGDEAIFSTPFQSSYLYRSNGTPEGTTFLGDVYATRMYPVGQKVFTEGFNLHATDGTPAGTTILGNGVFNTFYSGMAALGDLLIFAGDDAAGTELWRSDGTEAGTFLLKDINPGAANGIAGSFDTVVLGGYLYFMALDGGSNYELWRTDGSVAGTTLFKDINPGSAGFPGKFVSAGSSFYFRASSAGNGSELWKSDGTPEGTVMVKDIFPGSESSTPDNLTMVGSTLYFTAKTTSSGTPQLWKSDGTAEGTVLVTPALWQGVISEPTAVGDRLVFTAYTAATGEELWQSDGTAAGTFLLADVYPGAKSSDPQDLVAFKNQLYFLADDGFYGRELFRIDPKPPQVLDVINVSPDPRTGSVTTVDVKLSKPLDLATFTFADLQLTRNGANVPLNNMVTISHQGAGLYRIAGLGTFTWQGGTYNLTVKSAGLKDDLGQTGTGTASDQWTTDTTNLGGNLSYVENAPPVLVSPSAILNSNPAFSWANATLKLTLSAQATGSDRLALRNGGTITASGGKVFQNAVEIAIYSGGSGGTPLTILFNASATRTRVQDVLRLVEFRNTSESPPTAVRTLTISVQDQAATTLISKGKTIAVTAVNDAPVLSTGTNPTLNGILEDAPNPGGTLVSTFASPRISDPDSGAVKGIAVIGLTERLKGTWQYSSDGGATWLAIGNPSDTAARLLAPGYRVRFLPSANYFGTPQLKFRAWDQTDGKLPGAFADTTDKRGGTGAYSAATLSAKLTVSAVNDKPLLTLSGSLGYRRNDPAAVLAPNALVTDPDSANFGGGQLRVRIAVGGGNNNTLAIGSGFTVDASNNVRFGATIIGKRLSNGVGTNELKVQFNSSATKAIVQQLVRSITYKNIGGSAGQRKIVFTVSDGDGGLSDERFKTVNVT